MITAPIDLLLPLCAALFLTSSIRANDWTRYDSVEANGIERVLGGAETPFAISRFHGRTAFTTSRGLGGALRGTSRQEAIGADGVFTWLAGGPSWALQLLQPSYPEYAGYLLPSRFSKDALLNNRRSIERTIGKTMAGFQSGRLIERPCYVLSVGNLAAPGTFQKLWIDSESGISLRRQDVSLSQPDYEYRFAKFTAGTPIGEEPFRPPAGARVIRGLVHPNILLRVGIQRSEADYAKDISRLREKTQVGLGKWIETLPSTGLEYVHTYANEKTSVARKKSQRGGSLGSPELMPGGLPPGWNVSGKVDAERGTILLEFQTPQGGGPKAIIGLPQPGQPGNSFEMTISGNNGGADSVGISYVAYVSSDGSLVIAPGNSSDEAEKKRQQDNAELLGRNSFVQSDFLDRKTGDTVSFVQLRNVPLSSVFNLDRLTAQPRISSKALGEVRIYRTVKPYSVTLVAWKTDEGEYALTSTRLDPTALIALAEHTSSK